MDPRLSALLDRQDIQNVVLRYCRGIDRRDFDLVRACYHPDAVDHHGSFSGGVEEYVAWVDKLTSRYRWTMHFVANMLVEFGDTDSTSAPPSAACETYGVSLHRSDDPKDPKPYMNLATGFRYLDRFEKRDGQWKIAERNAISEWSMKMPEDLWWEIPESHRSGQRDKSDAIYQLLTTLAAHSKSQ